MDKGTRRLLGVFAHPDDEVFCAGGTLARYCAEGCEAMVVSATRGEAGQIRLASAATRRTLAAVREAELRAACDAMGVRRMRCLDYRDGTLRDVGVPTLQDDVARLLDEFEPDVVITFGDDGAYGHPDHVTISSATTRAVAAVGSPDLRLYHSHFPRSRLLLGERLARWLVGLDGRFRGSPDFALALSLFAEETTTMRFASDNVAVRYFPPGFAIVEQGERSASLFLVLMGEVEVDREDADGHRETLARLGPGQFFGEQAPASHQPRMANVRALSSVACLELAVPNESELFGGRGEDAHLLSEESTEVIDVVAPTTVIDVRDHLDAKVRAIAAHETQFPIQPDMFPTDMLMEMFGLEYFVRVSPPMPPERDLFAP